MLHDHYNTIIIGAGPAGLIAAIESHRPSGKILILEKMHKPALKLRISGKGRCNITNDASVKDFISHFGKNGRFLKYAFAEFFNTDLLKYFENLGVQSKLERGGRYFPRNDNAQNIVKALLKKVASQNIHISTNSDVKGIKKLPDNTFAVSINKKGQHITITADNVVLSTGGKSYPKTGSTGAGYTFATKLGHTITPAFPSIVPIETRGNTAKKLQGLHLRNVFVTVWCNNKKIGERFGEMEFTDFGVSGPIILAVSKTIVRLLNEKQKVTISIDLKPALDHKKIDKRLLREINDHGKQSFKKLIKGLLPLKLIPVFIEKLKIPENMPLNQTISVDRKKLRLLLKEFPLEVTGYRSFHEAIVTSGGVSINEINPQTMESKLVSGLYFAGEIIDIDADTGGFNLQAAFSTGWIAGRAIQREIQK
jgi:predicted Rossmann fold flavoprotein